MVDGENAGLSSREASALTVAGFEPTEWFSSRSLAAYFDLSKDTVRRLAWRGKIPGQIEVCGCVFYNKADVLTSFRPEVLERLRVEVEGPRGQGLELLSWVEKQYLGLLASTVTVEDWVQIVSVAVEQAKEGEWRARKWLADYLLGLPIQRVAAEVDMRTSKEYDDDERAAAVMILLNAVQRRTEEQIIDVVPSGDTGATDAD